MNSRVITIKHIGHSMLPSAEAIEGANCWYFCGGGATTASLRLLEVLDALIVFIELPI